MADNVTADAGAGGAVFATDDVSSVHYPISKITIGAFDSAGTLLTGGNGPVDAGCLRVTVASDSTGVLSVDDNGGALTVDWNGTAPPIGAGVEATALRVTVASDSTGSLAVTNAGTFAVQVDAALPTGANTIGEVIIGAATTDAGDLAKAEDAAHSTADVGVMALAVRNDQLATTVSADGDYAPLQVNARGALWTAGDPGSVDIFSRNIVANAYNDIDIQFFKGAPSALINVTTANSATAASNAGGALFSSSTNANGSVQGVTTEMTTYAAGSEIYAMFTAAFSAGIANSYMRIGLFNANEGFFLGYEGTAFGLTVRNNGSDAAQITVFSEDALDGSPGSQFTRAGVPEAIDYTKLNVYRIRFGWLGSAPVLWEVMAPDGHWVTFHKILYPNLQAVPSIRDANLPITLDITKTAAAATDITIQTDCWGAGSVAGPRTADADEFAFQTTTTLTNGSSYDSGVFALSPEFSQVHTSVLASHNGSITITWYSDAAGTDTIRTLVIAYTASDGYQLFSAPAFSPFVKYVFLNNSGSNQTDFYFDTKFMRRPLSPQILRLDGPLAGGMVASVNRSIITAYNGSAYTNVQSTTGGNLKVSLQEASDGLDIGAGNAGAETLRVSVATDDVNLSAIKTASELIDDAIYADDAAFTLTSSKVAAVGAIRDDALSTLTAVESDVVPLRVSSTGALHVTGGGGGTEYTLGTDTFTEATSIGSVAAVVRYDAGGSLVNTDNEMTALQVDSAGALRVTGGGGGTEYNEDVATPATIVGTATLVERDDALSTVTPIEGDWIGLRGTAEGALWTQDFNSDAILTDTNTIAGDTTSIDGKITACDTGAVVISSGTVDLGATDNAVLDDIAAKTSDPTVAVDDTTTHTAATTKVVGIGAVAAPTDTTVDANDIAMPAMSTDRRLHTDTQIVGQNADITIADGGNAITVDWAGTAPPIGAGTEAAALRVTLATDSTGVVSVDDGGSTLSVDLAPQNAGGCAVKKFLDLDETEEAVSTGTSQLFGIIAINISASVRYLKLYNASVATVVVGTTVPDMTIPIPTQGDTNGAGLVLAFDSGIAFGTAMTAAITTGFADNDSGAPGANEVIVNFIYKE